MRNLATLTPEHYPKLYENARAALSRCEQIDEVRDWASKAAAIASYAAQARDETLKAIAARIQARAVRRMGELLEQVPANRGGHDADERPSRKAVADAAGITRLQRNQASALAKIPRAEFERRIEATPAPKVYQLAKVNGQRGQPRKDHPRCPHCGRPMP